MSCVEAFFCGNTRNGFILGTILVGYYYFTAHSKYLMLIRVVKHKVFLNFHDAALHQPFQQVQHSPGFPSLFPKTKELCLPKGTVHPHTSVRGTYVKKNSVIIMLQIKLLS